MTDPRPLPGEGSERSIFIEALRRMSRDCEAPALLPECPFSVELSGGGRGCGEECETLLSEHDDREDDHDARRLSADLGYTPRRAPARRHPRGPHAPSSRAFDAGQVYFESKDGDRANWPLVALVYEVSELIAMPPIAWRHDREVCLAASLDELDQRGIDVDRLVRLGFGRLLATQLAMLAAGVYMDVVERVSATHPDAEQFPVEVQARLRPLIDEWALLLPEELPESDASGDHEDDEAFAVRLRRRLSVVFRKDFQDRVHSHVAGAPLVDLLNWKAPSVNDFAVVRLAEDPEQRRAYTWFADRFSVTYETQWHPDSLREEWRFLRGISPAPFPKELLEHRRVSQQRVAELLADQTADQFDENSITSEELKIEAVRFLREGRRAAAVAVFEAAQRTDPRNPELVNNYGFCLLPDSPEQGLEAIDRASHMGFSAPELNLANKAYGLHRLGRYAAVIEIAERALAEPVDPHPLPGYLWSFEEADRLLTNACPRCYVVDLALRAAERSADLNLLERWKKRVVEVTEGVQCSAPR